MTWEELEPQSVWRFFAGLAAVPRPSKREAAVQAHIRRVADGLGLPHRTDAVGNVAIDVPATPDCERAAPVVLQGHLDMVCEKNAGTPHDFERDPIRLIVDRDARGETIVRADGTTLGADNGIGVALALAVATDASVRHGPLEILCTCDEEAGMTGAKNLAPDFIRGRRMINLDSEEDDALYIGCAGGNDTTLTWELPTSPLEAGDEVLRVSVTGLRGGHSGSDIHTNRANAIKVLASVLGDAGDTALRLIELQGGSKRNAIPREALALVAGPRGVHDALKRAARAHAQVAARTHSEPSCSVIVEDGKPGQHRAADAAASRRLLDALRALPSGVLAVVPEIAGLVQTSNNVSTAVCERVTGSAASSDALRIVVGCLSRSSASSQVAETVAQIAAIGRLAGAQVAFGNAYPGWQPNVDSPTLAVCRRVYERLFGHAPRVTAIHAGLECGILGERIADLDMVSLGPRIEGAHSPDERVYVESVRKSYRYLAAIVADLGR